MKDYNKELMAAKSLALQAWQKIAPYYDQGVGFEAKADNSPVTIADKTSNAFILEGLRNLFPEDSIVSEEDANEVRGKRAWYIDPIDGTKGFIKRNGHFAIHIGFCEDENPTLGVVFWPVVGDLYYGVKGLGAWRENERGILELKVDDRHRSALIASTNGDGPPKGLENFYSSLGVKEFHNTGSEGLRLMKIAENITDTRISEKPSGLSTWDLCAPHAIFEAAGGFLKYSDGSPVLYKGQRGMGKRYIATNTKELLEKAITLSRSLNL